MTIRVFIADDHGVLRAGLRALLKGEPDLEVVGEAANGDDALAQAQRLRPDVLLADVSMPGATGIEVARQLAGSLPKTRVLILTMHEDGGLLQEALRVGSAGYIVKRAVEDELIHAIRKVASGEVYIHQDMRWAAPADMLPSSRRKSAQVEALSPQEADIVRLLAKGYTSRQIADALNLDLQSVETQRLTLTNKLGLRGRVELVRFAKEQGLI